MKLAAFFRSVSFLLLVATAARLQTPAWKRGRYRAVWKQRSGLFWALRHRLHGWAMLNQLFLATGRAVAGMEEADASWNTTRAIRASRWLRLKPSSSKDRHIWWFSFAWRNASNGRRSIPFFTPGVRSGRRRPAVYLAHRRHGAFESVHFLLSIAKSGRPAHRGTRYESRMPHCRRSRCILTSVAGQALEELAATNQPEKLRRQAIFWLGNSRGRRGFEVVSRIAREDPSDKIREHAIFALSQNKEPEAMSTVAAVAHNDSSPRVRGQAALFWLAQKAGQKAGRIVDQRCHRERSRNGKSRRRQSSLR